jgi:hypothetical protein
MKHVRFQPGEAVNGASCVPGVKHNVAKLRGGKLSGEQVFLSYLKKFFKR